MFYNDESPVKGMLQWEHVKTYNLSAAASLTVDGLDIAKEGRYRLEFDGKYVCTGTHDTRVLPNNQALNLRSVRNRWWAANGDSAQTLSYWMLTYHGGTGNTIYMIGNMDVYVHNEGYKYYDGFIITGHTVDVVRNVTHGYWHDVTNLTNMVIQWVNGPFTGKVHLYKRIQ